MKFKHGVVVGIFAGFLAACAGIVQRDKMAEAEREIDSVAIESKWYQQGWIDGKNFYRRYHSTIHSDCERCPH